MTSGYREIKADILRRITSGEFRPGAALPRETELAAHYGAARATVNRAMRELAEDGIVERRRRAGSRVRPSPARQARFDIPVVRREIEALGAVYGYRLVSSREKKAPRAVAQRLGLEAGAPMRHLLCLHSADGRPFQVEDRWISLATLPDAAAADFAASGPNEWLLAQVPFTDVEIALSAVPAGDAVAGLLGCAPGAALLQVERATWWEGRAVTLVRLIHRPGHRMTTRY